MAEAFNCIINKMFLFLGKIYEFVLCIQTLSNLDTNNVKKIYN